MEIKIKLEKGGKMPVYKTQGAACADCYACIENSIVIPKGKRTLIPLGFAIELPIGYEAVIRPRSGLTSKEIDNGIGTIDCEYRGEVKACVINSTDADYTVNNGDRICQMKIQEAKQFSFISVDELSDTVRGSGGFGSTGV